MPLTGKFDQAPLLQLYRQLAGLATASDLKGALDAIKARALPVPLPVVDFGVARDEWLEAIREGKAFTCPIDAPAPGAGNVNLVTLENGSANRALVMLISLGSSSAGEFKVLQRGAAFGPANAGQNLNVGGLAPTCVAGVVVPAGTLGALGTLLTSKVALANTQTEFGTPRGFIFEVGPGQNIIAGLEVQNVTLVGHLLWAEVPANGYP